MWSAGISGRSSRGSTGEKGELSPSPPSGERVGERGEPLDFPDDRLENGMEPKHHIVIPESQDCPTATPEVRVALGVVGSLIGMTCAIELESEQQLGTREIEKVRRDRMLAPELE